MLSIIAFYELIGQQDMLMDLLPKYEGSLTMANNGSYDFGNPGGKDLGVNFIYYNAAGYRPIVFKVLCLRRLWDKSNNCAVKTFKHGISSEPVSGSANQINFYSVPTTLKEFCTVSIKARAF